MRSGAWAFLASAALAVATRCDAYSVNSTAISRPFWGIGGLSGGGATSRLLPTYSSEMASQVLDYLFLPNFGASLHLLKVEIGGDAQSTDGTEPSHQHTQSDLNCYRGYEWWLLTEAKKRNPSIKTYGLSWAWPAWTGNFTGSPWNAVPLAANYTLNWLKCARDVYDVNIDYIGSWNERSYSSAYLKYLRNLLDSNGFSSTLIVAADGDWSIATDMLSDPQLSAAVFAVGAHYPGMTSSSDAQKTGHILLSSEDDSTYGDDIGTECWARVLNRNWVEGGMSGTVMWNLVSSYYPGLPWMGTSFLWAFQPWSGNYVVKSAVHVTAHWTQFTQPGWSYLAVDPQNGGSGFLSQGGSYNTIVENSDGTGDFSIIIEKIHHDRSKCVRPSLPDYSVAQETAQFTLTGPASTRARSLGRLAVWMSLFRYDGQEASTIFERQADIVVPAGSGPVQISVVVPVDAVITVSSVLQGPNKGEYPTPPAMTEFPVPYSDSFDSYPLHSEASYFADQAGSWEVLTANDSSHGKAMRQMVPTKPICWGDDVAPVSVFGAISWTDIDVQVDFMIEPQNNTDAAASLGGRVTGTTNAHGVFVSVTTQSWFLWYDLDDQTIVQNGPLPSSLEQGQWYTLELSVKGSTATAWLGGKQLFQADVSACNCPNGWAAIGTGFQFVPIWFDNFAVKSATDAGSICAPPQAGQNVVLQGASIDTDPTLKYDFNNQTSQLVLHSNPSLCLGVDGKDPNSGGPNVALVSCNASDSGQQWSLVVTATKTQIENGFQGLGYCLDVTDQGTSVGSNVELWQCNGGDNQKWVLDEDGYLINTGYTEPKKAAGACVSL